MGEFLSECSNLETTLISLMISLHQTTFFKTWREMLNETFGTRIKEFKRACDSYQFLPEHKQIIDEAYTALDALLPRRNFIVHGITHEIGFGDATPKAYRVGIPKGNLNYLNEFVLSHADVEHSFSAERVREATADCQNLTNKLAPIVTHLVQRMVANSQSY